MKKLIRETWNLELVPPHCHRRNVAEVAIKNFKAHFISILAGVDHDFPLHLWDKLLPQAELTINLLRQSSVNPKVSAHAHLFGPLDFNCFPLGPLGCAVQINVPPECRASWGMRAQKGWYIGCALDHYRLHTFIGKSSLQELVSGVVEFKHKSRTNPQLTHDDKTCGPTKICKPRSPASQTKEE